tara:strand:- start:1407 stop:2144 length:738 start_codon:yes stop_codon:yes gene_type:complete
VNKYELNHKIAVVTGASRGIGKQIAKDLIISGAKVALISRSEKELNIVSQEFSKLGKTIPLPLDIKNIEDVKNAIKTIIDKWGKIDILVNNAGVTRDNLLIKMKESDWDYVIDVNLKGTFNCIKSVIPHMLKKRSGKIINITSVVGISGNAGQSNYCASKAGVIGLTKSIGKEYGIKGINVNAIAPGFIETDMVQDLDSDSFIKNITLGRKGKPNDISTLVCFLSSNDGDYIANQVINVDGGLII